MGLGLTLLPLILAKVFDANWRNPKILGMFFSGHFVLALLIIWEAKYSARPIMPRSFVKNQTVFAVLAASLMTSMMVIQNYQYYTTYLYISRDVTYGQAVLLEHGYHIGYPVSTVLTGVAMKRFPTYKPFVWIGVMTNLVGLGMQIPARHPGSSTALVVVSQVFVGFGQGMFAIASQVAITAEVTKADVATAVGSFQIMVSFGYSFSSAIVAGIWTQYLPT